MRGGAMGVAYDWFSDLGFPGSVWRAIVRRYGNEGLTRRGDVKGTHPSWTPPVWVGRDGTRNQTHSWAWPETHPQNRFANPFDARGREGEGEREEEGRRGGWKVNIKQQKGSLSLLLQTWRPESVHVFTCIFIINNFIIIIITILSMRSRHTLQKECGKFKFVL